MVATPVPTDPNYGTPMNQPADTMLPRTAQILADNPWATVWQQPPIADYELKAAPIQNQNVAPVVKPKVTNIKPTNIVTPWINQPGGMSDIEAMSTKPIKQTPLTQSKEYLQTLSNNLKDKLKQQVQAGIPIDNAVRDDMFSQAVKDLGGNFDVNNPQAESIRKYVYDNALLGLQLGKDQNKTWDDYYGKTINQIERGQMISQIPSDEIAKRLVDGDLTYRDIRVLNATNPEKLKEISMLKRKYTTMKNANNIVSWGWTSTTTTITTPTMEETITENGNIVDTTIENIATSTVPDAKGTLAEQYDAMLNTPEIKAARDALIPVNEQIKLLELEKSNLAQTIEGKVTDKALFNAIYRDEAAGIDDALSALYIKQGTLAWTYNMLEQDAKDKFNVHLKDIELEQSKRASLAAAKQQQFENSMKTQQLWIALEELKIKMNNPNIQKISDTQYWYFDTLGRLNIVDPTIDSANLWINIWQQQWWLGNIWTGNVTNLSNSIDIDWNIWDAISIPMQATVLNSWIESQTGNKYITLQTDDGKILQFNHLESTWNGMQSMDLAPWTVIPAGSVFATLGNSGNVKDANWNWLRRNGSPTSTDAKSKLEQGYGSHLDFRWWDSVWQYNARGADWANQMDFGKLSNYMNGVSQTDSILAPATGVPLAYDRWIRALVPSTLMNSEVELKQLNDTIKAMYQWWINQSDAALAFMWFWVKDKADEPLALNLVSVARSLPDELSKWYVKTISDLINSWNKQWAMIKAENTMTDYIKKTEASNFVSENTVRLANQRATETLDYVSSLWEKNPIGNFEWTFQDWLWRFKWKEATTINNRITQLSAAMIHDLYGWQVTEWEKQMVSSLIPSLTDSMPNFIVKLNNLRDYPLERLNTQRESYGLPKLDVNTLFNKNSRIGLYNWILWEAPVEQALVNPLSAPVSNPYSRWKR